MSLGDAWSETTPGSVSKLNVSTIVYGSGTYLAGLDKTKHKILVCTSTGSGFTVDHVYLCTADGLSVEDLSDVNEHFHTGAGDGGSFIDIATGNAILDTGAQGFANLTADSTGLYRQSVTGTGAWTTQTDGTTAERYIRASTGATTASTLSAHTPINLSLEWAKPVKFAAKHQIQTATSIAVKCGFGMEDLAAADDNNRKEGAECCTTVNNNWFAASANGTTRSSSDTGVAFTTSKRAIVGIHHPDSTEFNLYVEDSSLYTKSSNIPTTASSNQPSRGAIFRYTVKNNTGADRLFNFYGTRLIYFVNDSSFWF